MIPAGLTLLAAIVLLGGFSFSARAKRPKLLRIGACLSATGIMLLWLLPWWLFRADTGVWAMPAFIGAMFVAVSFLALGLQLMARACGAREESRNEQLLSEFMQRNDLP